MGVKQGAPTSPADRSGCRRPRGSPRCRSAGRGRGACPAAGEDDRVADGDGQELDEDPPEVFDGAQVAGRSAVGDQADRSGPPFVHKPVDGGFERAGEAAVVLGCDGHGRVRPGPVTYSPRAPSRACRSQAGVGVDLSRRAFCAPSRAGWLPANLGCGGLYRRSRTGAFRADLGHIRDPPAKISHANSESDTTPKLTTFTYTARCQRLRQVKGNGKPSTSATTSTVWSGSRQRKRPTARSLPNTPSTTTSTGSAAEMWAGS